MATTSVASVARSAHTASCDDDELSSFSPPAYLRTRSMLKLSIFVMSGVLGYAFWWAADALGADFFVSCLISGAGAVFSCWAGWKIYQRLLS